MDGLLNSTPQSRSGRILRAVDGSRAAKSAAYAVARIASTLQWQIHAQYVVDLSQTFELFADSSPETGRPEDNLSNAERAKAFRQRGTLALNEVECCAAR